MTFIIIVSGSKSVSLVEIVALNQRIHDGKSFIIHLNMFLDIVALHNYKFFKDKLVLYNSMYT